MRARQINVATAAINSGTIDGATIGATTPAAGTFTTVNKIIFTQPAASATLTILNGKTATFSNTLTLAGTDSTTMTFPTTSATIARTDAANAFTGNQSMSGFVAIGTTPSTTRTLYVAKSNTGGTTAVGVRSDGTFQSDVTSVGKLFQAVTATQATTFTLADLTAFSAEQGGIGSGSTVTNQYGFSAQSSLTGGANNYGFYSNISSASARWNFFANGTANNAFAGNTRFGGTTAPTVAIDVTGAVLVSGTITPSGGIVGTTAGGDATAGNVGEYLSASLAVGSATSLTTATAKTVINLSLTAGDWDITGVINFIPAASTNTTLLFMGTSTTDNTIGADNSYASNAYPVSGNVTTSGHYRKNVPTVRVNISSTTTIYLIAQATFTVSTMTAYGTICARRAR